jgi:hypothetical protein
VSWTIYLNKHKCSASEEINGNPMFLQIAAGQFCLLSYWLMAGLWAFPSGFPLPFKHCLKAFQLPVGISQQLPYPFSSDKRLSNSLSEHFPAAIS